MKDCGPEEMYGDERKNALMDLLAQMSQLIEKGYGDSEEKLEEAQPEMAEEMMGEEPATEGEPNPYKEDMARLMGKRSPEKKDGVAVVISAGKGMPGRGKKKGKFA
jgi:hypothetical protein